MGIGELLLVAVALSMDAFAVGLTNGMAESKMRIGKILLIAAFYGFFQFLMPVAGYCFSGIFSSLIEKIAPWLSFILLAFIGGKMVFDGVREMQKNRRGAEESTAGKPLTLGTLTLQAAATSIDAAAVGVSFLALSTAGTLCLNIWWDALIIGGVTFTLSVLAVFLGKLIGNKLAEKAEIAGGVVLIVIGVKILIESLI